MGAELCCRATGATAGRLSAYLLERCGSEAAQLCAHAVHSGGGGWSAGVPVFRLEGVWGFSKRCVRHSGGVWASDPRRSFHDSPLAVSQSLLFGLARGAHRRLRRERTPQYSSRSPRRTYWLFRGKKRAQTQLTKELYWSGCSHIQKCAHMIQSPPARPALRRASAAEFAVPPRRASAPEFGQIVNRTPPEDQAVHHIHRQVAKLELESQKTYARSPSLESQIAAPLAAPPPPVSPPGSPRSITRKFYVFPETQAPDVVPWPERCRSAPSVSIDEVLAPLTRL